MYIYMNLNAVISDADLYAAVGDTLRKLAISFQFQIESLQSSIPHIPFIM